MSESKTEVNEDMFEEDALDTLVTHIVFRKGKPSPWP
jgi:hypothetical protein